MYLLGINLHRFSLGALIIALGMLCRECHSGITEAHARVGVSNVEQSRYAREHSTGCHVRGKSPNAWPRILGRRPTVFIAILAFVPPGLGKMTCRIRRDRYRICLGVHC